MTQPILTNQPTWVKNLGTKLIKDVQITVDDKTIYDSTKDKDKEEKLKLIVEIDELKNFGIKSHKEVYLDHSYEEIKFCYEHMKHQYNQLNKSDKTL